MIEWKPSFETGHPLVDNDHRRLVSALNELDTALRDGAGKEKVTAMVAFLNTYAREHFAREEAHMAKVGCPAAAENLRAHAEFVAKLDRWLVQLQSGPTLSLVLGVHTETCQWIRAHILRVDCQLRGCRAA